MTVDLGQAGTFHLYPSQDNNYTRGLNLNWIAMSMLMSPSVISKTTSIPGSADEGDQYIDPATLRVFAWNDGFTDNDPNGGPPNVSPAGWYSLAPKPGMFMHVQDEEKVYMYTNEGLWMEIWDINATHHPVARELPFYSPGGLRPGATIFSYVAALQLTLPAGSVAGGAACEVAPTGEVVLGINKSGAQVGTITFASGSTSGVINIPAEVIVQPALPGENMYVQANMMTIVSPGDVHGLVGLSVTLRGEIQAID